MLDELKIHAEELEGSEPQRGALLLRAVKKVEEGLEELAKLGYRLQVAEPILAGEPQQEAEPAPEPFPEPEAVASAAPPSEPPPAPVRIDLPPVVAPES